MRYFYDCEFIEDGRTITLVSIGVVDEHGREFYAVSTEFDPSLAIDWVRRNVLNQLPPPASPVWRSRVQIRDDLLRYLLEPREPVELWAWMASYDHVALAQLWGDMRALPRQLPRFTHELRQLWEQAGCPPLPAAGPDAHDALADARHNLARWKVIVEGDSERASSEVRARSGAGAEPSGEYRRRQRASIERGTSEERSGRGAER